MLNGTSKNIMPLVIEQLGLKTTDEFYLYDGEGNPVESKWDVPAKFSISPIGLMSTDIRKPNDFLPELLNGNLMAVKLPFKPAEYQMYYYYDMATKAIIHSEFHAWCNKDLMNWKCGNCFEEKEEAEQYGKLILEEIVEDWKE